jgi:hypothetical protein
MAWIPEAMKPELTLPIICTKSLPRSIENFKGGFLRASITASFFPTFDSLILDKACHVQAHTSKAKSTLI